MGPKAPRNDCRGEPLEGDGGSVEHQPLHGADARHGQQLLHALPTTPREKHSERQEDQPEVPGHPQIRTLSERLAQGTKVPNADCLFRWFKAGTSLRKAFWGYNRWQSCRWNQAQNLDRMKFSRH